MDDYFLDMPFHVLVRAYATPLHSWLEQLETAHSKHDAKESAKQLIATAAELLRSLEGES